MDKTTLVERDYKDGEMLIRQLDECGFPVHSALWIYNSEAEQWRFVIASKKVTFIGYKQSYSKIKDIISQQMPSSFGIRLHDISVTSPSNILIDTLSQAVQTAPDSISGIRFSNNSIGNSYIEDAYIYRLQPNPGA